MHQCSAYLYVNQQQPCQCSPIASIVSQFQHHTITVKCQTHCTAMTGGRVHAVNEYRNLSLFTHAQKSQQKKVSCTVLAMRAIFIAIYTLTLASAKRADLLKGLSTESAGEHFTNDLPLDPTAKSGLNAKVSSFCHCCQCYLLLLIVVIAVVCLFVTLPAFFRHEGDMTFLDIPGEESNQQHRGKRNAVLNNRYIWPGGRIPYQIAPTFDGSSCSTYSQLCTSTE